MACGVVEQHRVTGLRWHPHPTAGPMLLELYFIDGPKVNTLVPGQLPKFFYMPVGLVGRGWQSGDVAWAIGTPVPETSAGIDARPG